MFDISGNDYKSNQVQFNKIDTKQVSLALYQGHHQVGAPHTRRSYTVMGLCEVCIGLLKGTCRVIGT